VNGDVSECVVYSLSSLNVECSDIVAASSASAADVANSLELVCVLQSSKRP